MSNLPLFCRWYYDIKPMIPRWLQLCLRRRHVAAKREKHQDCWPIDVRAAKKPAQWEGWPGARRFALVLTHDVETMRGHERVLELMEVEKAEGFRSSFNFVPERYAVSPDLRSRLAAEGFEVGVHDLRHDGKLYRDEKTFARCALRINHYLREWKAEGFRSGAMHCNLEWIKRLEILYDSSTFDTDPFEPQPDGRQTIFPFLVGTGPEREPYVELPYTLPQDFTVFVLMEERSTRIWEEKLAWIAEQGGMALLITHPDYMSFAKRGRGIDEYEASLYRDFLRKVRSRYAGQYWNALPREVATFWKQGVRRGPGGAWMVAS